MRIRLTLLALLAVLGAVWMASSAWAHAIIRATTPGDGETLDATPSEVTLEFNEPVTVSPGSLRVFDADGARVDRGDAQARAETSSVAVSLEPDLGEGTYVVSWRVLSADAHPVHGAFVYTVGTGTADESRIAEILQGTSDTGLQTVAAVFRFLQYTAGLLAAGAVFFLVWVHDRRGAERRALLRITTVAAVVAGAVAVLGVGVQAALATGLGLRAAVDPVALGDVAASTYGLSAAALLTGAVVLLVGARRMWDDWAVVTAVTGAVILVGAFALTGHTASTHPRWLVVSADIAHTSAAAAWFGGLVLLGWVLHRRRREDGDALHGAAMIGRFSSVATLAILGVVVAGSALGWAEVRAPRALWSTAYGWTLVAKVAVVALVLGLGAYNKRRLVPAITRAGDGADADARSWDRLRAIVRVEAAGLCLALAVTAVLVNLVPARDAAGVTGPLSVREPMGEEYLVDLTVDPNRAGSNELHIYLFTADGRVADAEHMLVGLSLSAENIGPIEREPTRLAPGHWTLGGAQLPIPGRWTVTLTASVSRFEEATVDIPIDVGG